MADEHTSNYIPLTTTTTTTLTEKQKLNLRFGGLRYQFQGPSTRGPNRIVSESSSAYTHPKTS